jgi:protease IV
VIRNVVTLAVLSSVALSSAACGVRDPEKQRKLVAESLVEIDLSEPPEERTSPFLGDGRPSHFDAIMRTRKLASEPLARGLFLRVGSFGGRFADVDDWAEVIEQFRGKKKPVHCQFDELDNGGYALAAHCDRLSMTPAGLLNLVGLGAQVVHGRNLLDQLGVKAEIFQAGKYKGAAEPFTRDAISPEQRESLETLLADLDQSFRGHLGQRLKGDAAQLQKVIDEGPYTSDSARARGLIDAVAYDDEARAHAKQAANARVLHRPFEVNDKQTLSLSSLVKALSGRSEPAHGGRPRLGVAFLTGEITDGEGRGMQGVGSDPFVKALRRWGDQPEVRAVVLRIESPGGSALASDRMWHAVQRVAKRKPVVVSLGDMAASGGYYIASAGSVIVAAPGSIVGSIGVVGGKVVVEGLADRVGVNVTTLARAAHSAWLSPFAAFSDSERSAFESMLQNTYGRFLTRVAQGRKREVAAIVPAAEGRVMGGARARSLGLVDEVGGLVRAVDLARARAKLPDNAPIETWPGAEDPLTALSSLMETRAARASWSAELEAALPVELRSAGSLIHGLRDAREQALTVLPFSLYVH